MNIIADMWKGFPGMRWEILVTHTLRAWLFKLGLFFPHQPHRRCQGSSRQPNQESGHRVGGLWGPRQCCSTSRCRAAFNLGTLVEVRLFRCVCLYELQGTIFSKTAVENYKDLGPHLFKMSVPHCPAKRLGVPEEVCDCRKTPTSQGNLFIKQTKTRLCFRNETGFVFMLCFLPRYHQQCVSCSHLLPPMFLEPP